LPKTSIVIATADTASENAGECIRSIKKHSENYELIIIDNNRTSDFNHGAELNRGMKIAKGEYILLVDDDVMVTEGWLNSLIRCAERDTKIGIVGSKMISRDGRITHTGGFIQPFQGYAPLRVGHLIDDVKEDRAVQYVCLACMLIKRKVIEEIGYLDEELQMNFEDPDICLRAWEKGWKVMCTPKSVVIHEEWKGVKKDLKNGKEILDRDRAVFVRKWVNTGRLNKVFSFKATPRGILWSVKCASVA
jgi:GT2 family glycosyltransferase